MTWLAKGKKKTGKLSAIPGRVTVQSDIQCIDRLPSVMLQQDFNGSLDAEKMVRIILFGIFEVCKAQIIDRNLLRFECGKGGIGECLNLELPESGIGFGRAGAPQHNFLAAQIDAIVTSVLTDFEDSGGLGYIFLCHIADLSTVRPQILRSLG